MELKALSDQGVFFQSHGHTHEIFHKNQSASTINSELNTSKNILEKKLGKEITWYAYPNGNSEQEKLAYLVGKSGYELGFSLGAKTWSSEQEKMLIPRFDAHQVKWLK